MLMSTRSTDAGPWAPWRTTGIVSATVRWACLLCWVVGAAAGAVQAAVGDSAAAKLRAAIRLPEVSVEYRFGLSDVREWHGDDDIPDPESEAGRLRTRLTGSPSDAPLLHRIAQVMAMSGDQARKVEAYRIATESARAWMAAAPSEAGAQRTLAACLVDSGASDEAEQLLKPLTGPGSTDAAAFSILALLEHKRGDRLWMRDPSRGFLSLVTGGEPPMPGDAARARHHYALAMQAIDRAVRLEPGEARHLTRRVGIRAMESLLEASMNPVADVGRRGEHMMSAMFPAAAIPDIEAASRLRPEDVRIQTALLVHHVAPHLWAVMVAHEHGDSAGDFMRRLPPQIQERIQAVIVKLERMAESPDARTAAQALESLAFAKGMLAFDPSALARYAGRAFEKDPHRQSSFEMALGGCIASKEPDLGRAERLVRERARVRDDERVQLLLVKVLDRRGSGAEALETVRRARGKHPESSELQAAELLLLVKRPEIDPGADVDALSDAMLKRFQAMPDGQFKMRLSRQFFGYSVIRLALMGELDEARRRLRGALAQNPGDEYLAEIDRLLRETAGN